MNKLEKLESAFFQRTIPLISKFISMLKKRNRQSEAHNFSYQLPKFVIFISDAKPYIHSLSEIDRLDMENYIINLRTEDYPIADGTIPNRNNHVYRCLRAVNKFFEYLIAIEGDLDLYDLPKPDLIIKADYPNPHRLGVKHFPAWLDKLMLQEIRELPESTKRQLKFKTMMLFIYQTGSRLYDLCTLEYNCTFVKLGFNWVRIFSNKTQKEYEIPITFELFGYLERYRKIESGKIKLHPTSRRKMKFLFWTTDTEAKIYAVTMARNIKYFTRHVRNKAVELGYPTEDIKGLPLTSHKFRHSVGIRLTRMGADPMLVAEFLGHDDLSMAQSYIQESEQEVEDIMNELIADDSLELKEIDDIVDGIELNREDILEHEGVVCKCLGGLCVHMGGKSPCGEDGYDCWLCDNIGPDFDDPNYLEFLEKELNEHKQLEKRNLDFGYLGAAKVEKQVIQRISDFMEEWKNYHACKKGNQETRKAL